MRDIRAIDPSSVRDAVAPPPSTLERATGRFQQVLRNTVERGANGADPALRPAAESTAAAAEAGRFGQAAGSNDVAALSRTVSDAVANRLEQVNAAEHVSQDAMRTMLTGGDIQLHNVILAAERAKLELQLTMQLRNKLIEAYQEVMRTPL